MPKIPEWKIDGIGAKNMPVFYLLQQHILQSSLTQSCFSRYSSLKLLSCERQNFFYKFSLIGETGNFVLATHFALASKPLGKGSTGQSSH